MNLNKNETATKNKWQSQKTLIELICTELPKKSV